MAAVLQSADLATEALSYRYNGGGLNNQKLALFGLFLKAWRDGPRRVILPDLRLFDHRLSDLSNYGLITFNEALQRGPLRAFAARHGIEILDLPPQGDEGGWDYFHEAMNYIPRAALLGDLTPESFVCDFFRSLVPAVEHAGLAQRVIDAAFSRQGIRLALQLRIETDWADHVAHRLGPAIAVVEDNGPTFPEIVRKICNTAPVNGRPGIYVVCDEAALPVPKEGIRGAIRREFGIDLFWKSDLIAQDELAKLSLLDLSMLDFELCLAAELFVGLTRSTFSNMVALEKYSRTEARVERHYIYNMLGSRLALRTDNGAFEVPELAAAADPWDQAHSFHLAQAFQAAGDRERALERYCARAEAGFGDREEIYVSLYRAAQIKAELGAPAGEVIATYLRAAAILPSRAEARHGASRYARLNNMFKEGYEIAAPAIDLAAPRVGRFVERWIYEWALLDEYAVNAYWAGRFQESLDACERLLHEGKLPEPQRERVEANARFARMKLASLNSVAVAPENGEKIPRKYENSCGVPSPAEPRDAASDQKSHGSHPNGQDPNSHPQPRATYKKLIRFNICRVTFDYDAHPLFDYTIRAIREALIDLGYDCSVKDNELMPGAVNILIGVIVWAARDHRLSYLNSAPYVVFQLEQLLDNEGLPHWVPEYVDVLRSANFLLEYSPSGMDYLRKIDLGERAVYVPPSFHRSLEEFEPSSEPDIDVLFVGNYSPRRSKIVDDLRKEGVLVVHAFDAYGDHLIDYMKRGKIILNIHVRDGWHVLETVRLSYALANRCFVISETGDHNPYGSGVVYAEYGNLVSTCLEYLGPSAGKRAAVATEGYLHYRRSDLVADLGDAIEKMPIEELILLKSTELADTIVAPAAKPTVTFFGEGEERFGGTLSRFCHEFHYRAHRLTGLCRMMAQENADKGGVGAWHNYTLLYDHLFGETRQSI